MALLSTDMSLSFLTMMKIYVTRGTIEVFFKEMKPHLRLGQAPSRHFDAQIAHVTTCCSLYTFFAYFRRVHAYESLGTLFEGIGAAWVEKNLHFSPRRERSSMKEGFPSANGWNTV